LDKEANLRDPGAVQQESAPPVQSEVARKNRRKPCQTSRLPESNAGIQKIHLAAGGKRKCQAGATIATPPGRD
jgi:hypothetical protein